MKEASRRDMLRPLIAVLLVPALLLGAVAWAANGQTLDPAPGPEATCAAVTYGEIPAAAISQHRAPSVARDGFEGAHAYVVQEGDTLDSIAAAFGVSPSSIADRNALPSGTALVPGDTVFIPHPTPTPMPTPTPTTAPTATPTPSDAAAQLVRHGPRTSNRVALTFDMNGRPGASESIVRWLAENEVPAAVFVTGVLVDNTAMGAEVVRLVDSNRDLLELGNHSYTHPPLTTRTDEQIRSELLRTEQAVARKSTVPMLRYLRPPYGDCNQRVLRVAGAAGYTKSVLWDVDPQDWRGHSASVITANVLQNVQAGSIVLLHLHGANTLSALPGIVAGLRERGFELVKLSELLE
jgi:peptidoglycan/xylan/chitin deacetylase (PgdA/CDA1 family)